MHVQQLLEFPVVTESCQRWHHGRHSFTRTRDGGFDPRRYQVRPLAHAEAKSYVLTHHYAGSFPAARFCYGLYLTDDPDPLVGVAVFSVPASAKVITRVFPELDVRSAVELGRLVLEGPPAGASPRSQRAPANAESWFVAQAARDLAARDIHGMIAFADPVPRRRADGSVLKPGHTGVIYQALGGNPTGMRYTGRGTARTLWLAPDGTVLSERTLQKIRAQEQGHEYGERLLISHGARAPRAGADMRAWLRQSLIDIQARRLTHRGNHRFAMPLGTTRRARADVHITLPPLPYPKSPDQ